MLTVILTFHSMSNTIPFLIHLPEKMASLGREGSPQRRKWQPTPVFLPGKFHGQRSLAGYSPWGCKELDTTEPLTLLQHTLMMTVTARMSWVCFILWCNKLSPNWVALECRWLDGLRVPYKAAAGCCRGHQKLWPKLESGRARIWACAFPTPEPTQQCLSVYGFGPPDDELSHGDACIVWGPALSSWHKT